MNDRGLNLSFFGGACRAARLAVLALLCLGAVILSVPAVTAQTATLQTFTLSTLEIVTATGRHAFRVELAQTDQQRSQGTCRREDPLGVELQRAGDESSCVFDQPEWNDDAPEPS